MTLTSRNNIRCSSNSSCHGPTYDRLNLTYSPPTKTDNGSGIDSFITSATELSSTLATFSTERL